MTNKQTTRRIIPHKGDESGGRTVRFNGRCTEKIKRMAVEIKQATGETVADLFEEIVLLRHAELT